MSILCLHCKAGSKRVVGRSVVLESRIVASHGLYRGRSTRTRTMRRRRRCMDCGFVWTTLEYVEPAKRGKNNARFGRVKES